MLMIALFTLFVIGILWYLQRCKNWREKFGRFDQVPGPRNYPLIGNIWILGSVSRSKRLEFAASLTQKYGTLYKLWAGNWPVVMCANAEDAEIILTSRVNIEKSWAYNFVIPWLGTGLITSGGSKWHQRRKLLTPAFHFSILESFLPIIAEQSRIFVEKLKPLEGGEEFNIFPFVNRFTLDVICETAMGVKLNSQNSETSEYLQHVQKITNIILNRVLRPWWHNQYLYSYSSLYKEEVKTLKVLHSMSMNVIQKSRQKRCEANLNAANTSRNNDSKKRSKAFLDLLLDISENSRVHLTDEDIREEVDTFMFAGHDTSASGISSTIHLLSTHPEVQEKVVEELLSVFGDSDRDPTLQDVSKLKYLECVIKESHRLLPPVPAVSRLLSETVTLGGQYSIPAGTIVRINIFGIHRREAYFPNPDQFNPENFTIEKARSRHPFAFIPFSAGVRNCIGQKFAILEEKIVISSLLRCCKIESSQRTEDLGLYDELVLRHNNGVRIRVTPRTWKNC